MLQRVVSRFSVENFWSHSAENFRRGTLLLCVPERFWYRTNLWTRVGGLGEVLGFSAEHFLSHSAEKVRRGALLCCVPESF